ncbi:MAG: GNAT family N-acetyltransferase [Gemmatimonadaceae bacterium]|nr:GNAT family N-acetyltransferase [Gemmatimonadaceae bacterium]
MSAPAGTTVRTTTPADFDGIIRLSGEVYADAAGWSAGALASHHQIFPEGQFVAVRDDTGEVVGMAASLIVLWDDYELTDTWRDFTDGGMFTNHDPAHGRTLYGAEVMVSPELQGAGIGKQLYAAREELVVGLGLLRIRAGARLRGYSNYAGGMSAQEYTQAVLTEEIGDPTLTFQLRRGFQVIGVVSGYLRNDPESLGYAAVIEWVNDEVASCEGYTAPRWSLGRAASRGTSTVPPPA